MHTLDATWFVLAKPTVGLYMADVEKLIHVLHRLIIRILGFSVMVMVMVETDFDVIAKVNWMIDLRAQGGMGGD